MRLLQKVKQWAARRQQDATLVCTAFQHLNSRRKLNGDDAGQPAMEGVTGKI